MKQRFVIAILIAMFSRHGMAQWQVAAKDSRISFISVKKGDVGEVHHFTQFTGELADWS